MKLKKKEYYNYDKELYNVVEVEGIYVGMQYGFRMFRPTTYKTPNETWAWQVNEFCEIVGVDSNYSPDIIEITTRCIECGNMETIKVSKEDLDHYNLGKVNIQQIFTTLTPEEREFHFISKICGKCWDSMFGDEDELD